MKKILLILCLVTLVCVAGCKKTEQIPTETLPMDAVEFLAPTEIITPMEKWDKPEVLTVMQWGTYSGAYVEDGSHRTVEKVACILVKNATEQYLDYGEVKATVGDKTCSFVVTGLPAGACAWVAEASAQTMEAGEEFVYLEQTVSQLRDLPQTEGIEVLCLNGEIRVTNNSKKDYSEIRVYYKQLNSDGNYLGGITYTVTAGAVEKGQTMQITAGHSTETDCAVVRVDCTE